MQAVVLHPAVQSLEIIMGKADAIRAAYASRSMTTHGIIENKEETKLDEFLEWCFDHTNCSDEYRELHKARGMCVGDVLVVFDHGAYACMSSGWEKIE
jgi:hypothetical protein